MMRAPHFWSAGLDPKSRAAAPLVRVLLTPFSLLYKTATARRISKSTPAKLPIPVICVGNLTSGGSGKTPIVETLRTLLTTRGIQAASLSRGYGGRLTGPLAVSPETHSASDVGDEPLMLSHSGSSWISRDRYAGGSAMVEAGITAIIMDDGHQNPQLAKDLSLLVIDSDAPFGNGYVIPKGPLREPPSAGLARADAVILMGGSAIPTVVDASGIPVVRARLVQTSPLPTGPIFAFAGIGRPQRFFDSISRAGVDVRDTLSFPDHHPYTLKDIAKLRGFASAHDYKLVTTRKDYVRLPAEARADIVPIDVQVEFDDIAELSALLSPLFKGRLNG
ncbi:MAG: tetraacyldisaccharide 4'-kinase [Hyphomonadaceae bacterium]